MQRLRSRLPPVNTLVVFEASARHLSFTRAAVELGVTREAVSRQIRSLERHLSVKLFDRLHRAIELTEAGGNFYETVHHNLEEIADQAQRLGRARHRERVTITATVAIASFWLTPRLPRFRSVHPHTEIRVVVSDTALDLRREGIDIALRYGDADWPALDAQKLFGCDSFPICTTEYLSNNTVIANEADLCEHTLLNLDGSMHDTEDWGWWLSEGLGTDVDTDNLDIIGFDNYSNVIQATLDHQGIALGFSGIVDGLMADGKLVNAIDVRRSPGHAVYVTKPRNIEPTGIAEHFYDWVVAEADSTASAR